MLKNSINCIKNILGYPSRWYIRKKFDVYDMNGYFKEKQRIDNLEEEYDPLSQDEHSFRKHLDNMEHMRQIAGVIRFDAWEKDKECERSELIDAIVHGNKDFPEEYSDEIKYLREKGDLYIYPYPYTEKYSTLKETFTVYKEKRNQYVLHNGKKLFYPYSFSSDEVLENYTQLITEQDALSPHQYFSENVNFEKGIFVDVGSAEGIISLDIIEKADEVYLLERSKEWISALQDTFKDYMDKIHIIPYYAGAFDSDITITLDTLLSKYVNEDIFVKIDVEGMELEVLRGCINTFKKNNCKFSCASYHTNTMEKKLCDFFEKSGFCTETSNGYMLFTFGYMTMKNGMYEKIEYPYFRKGIVRAYKK